MATALIVGGAAAVGDTSARSRGDAGQEDAVARGERTNKDNVKKNICLARDTESDTLPGSLTFQT